MSLRDIAKSALDVLIKVFKVPVASVRDDVRVDKALAGCPPTTIETFEECRQAMRAFGYTVSDSLADTLESIRARLK